MPEDQQNVCYVTLSVSVEKHTNSCVAYTYYIITSRFTFTMDSSLTVQKRKERYLDVFNTNR